MPRKKDTILPAKIVKAEIIQKDPVFTTPNFLSWTKETLESLPPLLDGWIHLYIHLQVEGIKAERTVKEVKRDLARFLAFFQGYTHANDVTLWKPQVTQRFIEDLEDQGKSPATIKRALTFVKSFAKWVRANRPDFFSLGDPTQGAKPPIQDALRPKGLTRKQAKLLLDAARNRVLKAQSKQGWSSLQRPHRDLAILMLMLNAGLRREEVCNLDMAQFQGKKLVNVKCKGNIYRDVLLGTDTLMAIQDYLDQERPKDVRFFNDTSPLFMPPNARARGKATGRISKRAINQIMDKIGKDANAHLPEDQRFHVHPHMLRHTHAYLLLEEGRDPTYIQKRLGHQSMNYVSLYTQLPESEEQRVVDAVELK